VLHFSCALEITFTLCHHNVSCDGIMISAGRWRSSMGSDVYKRQTDEDFLLRFYSRRFLAGHEVFCRTDRFASGQLTVSQEVINVGKTRGLCISQILERTFLTMKPVLKCRSNILQLDLSQRSRNKRNYAKTTKSRHHGNAPE
jgi:hypothetical protein